MSRRMSEQTAAMEKMRLISKILRRSFGPFAIQMAVHPEQEMVLILRRCPFSNLLERDRSASAVPLEQVEHRFRLLSP